MAKRPRKRRRPDKPWQRHVAETTWMLCDMMRAKQPTITNEQLRKELIGATREALGDGPFSGMIRTWDGPNGPEPIGRPPAFYRLLMDKYLPNYREPAVAESFMVMVQRALDTWLGPDARATA